VEPQSIDSRESVFSMQREKLREKRTDPSHTPQQNRSSSPCTFTVTHCLEVVKHFAAVDSRNFLRVCEG
jgi:hypothetical protein